VENFGFADPTNRVNGEHGDAKIIVSGRSKVHER